MPTLITYLWLGLGGAIGTIGRYWLNGVVSTWFTTFPLGTLVVNVTGSFIIAFFYTLTAPDSRVLASPDMRTFFMAGICGGYTTFSAFSLQTLNLARDGQWLYAGLNVLGSVALCLFAAWLGYIAAMFLNSMKGS
jgi:CrcB protein